MKPGKPFQISTPVAVSAIRGTTVDFALNDAGQLTVDLHDGKVQTFDADKGFDLKLEGDKTITVYFDTATGAIVVKNDCTSAGKVDFAFGGALYSADPCQEVSTAGGTAGGNIDIPGGPGDDPETEIDPGDDDGTPPPPLTSGGGEEPPSSPE